MNSQPVKQPIVYMPHGGGPCFFMDGLGPPGTWIGMANWLKAFGIAATPKPRALVVVSAHWEEKKITVLRSDRPNLLYDYYDFPEHTYKIQYPAPGSPEVAAEVMDCLQQANIEGVYEDKRGFDHGVFIPLKVAFPNAELPIVQVSLKAGLDPVEHLQLGQALARLREKCILIIGSGMSYHNLSRFRFGGNCDAEAFDGWLNDTITKSSPLKRKQLLTNWAAVPGARNCHPREEHLIPLMVCAGAAEDDPGYRIYNEAVLGSPISAFSFGKQIMPSV